MNRKALFLSAVGLIALAFVMVTVLFQNNQSSSQSASAGRNQGVAERAGAPTKGPDDARVTIVEFFDPACGTCRDFSPLLSQLISLYPGKLRVMARYAPLHTGSDQVVKMLEAAHQQGKFWQALDLLFKNQNRWVMNHVSQPMRARAILNALDVDQDRLTEDMNSDGVLQVIQKDVEDAQTLGVRATPEFYVNGQPLPSFGFEQLSQLVKQAVDEAY